MRMMSERSPRIAVLVDVEAIARSLHGLLSVIIIGLRFFCFVFCSFCCRRCDCVT